MSNRRRSANPPIAAHVTNVTTRGCDDLSRHTYMCFMTIVDGEASSAGDVEQSIPRKIVLQQGRSKLLAPEIPLF